MVFSEYLFKIPYSIAWRLANSHNYSFPVVFYCTDYLDYVIFEPIKKHLPDITIAAKNRAVQKELSDKGISSILLPVYPKVVIMARHALHKFPSKKVIKIGMRHGAFNFKKFIKASQYNKFNLFLFTSRQELKDAQEFGIKCGASVGFPKIDELHNNSITQEQIAKVKEELDIVNDKSALLLTATWNNSNLSAIKLWYEKLSLLTENYNVLVTTHHFMDKSFVDVIKQTDNVHFIADQNINKYLLTADILIGDTSSIIAEFCSLDKPIITFNISLQGRLNPEIVKMLDEISFRVNSFDELQNILPVALKNKTLHSEKRKKYNSIMFDNLDGNAGKRAAEEILKCINDEDISF
ncbi:MAG: hypothetical protein GY936_00360 [Ignavibacteriae bacterium]|nr:hypothetical protein [Ignavibacteriota bacterium]